MLFFFNETATTEIYTYRHTRSLHDAFPISLRYRGVQHYCGSQQHIEDYAERRAAIVERTTYLQSVIAALTDAGFAPAIVRSDEHTSELQSLMRISYAVFCLKKKTNNKADMHNDAQHCQHELKHYCIT